MRIKPYIVLSLATIFAGVGFGTIMMTSDPYTAEPAMIGLFWLSLSLFAWAFFGTFFSLIGQRLAVALSSSLVWTAGVLSLALLSHQGGPSKRLSAGVILATIVITIGIWIRSRKSNKQP